MKNKRTRKKSKKWIDAVIVAVGIAVLTPIFLYFDIFTQKSVYYEYSKEEQMANEKISENTHDCDFDVNGNITIKKSLISSETLSYFNVEDHDFRILAYTTKNLEFKTAIDLCENCYVNGSSGWYYENSGMLYCSTCGESITLDEMGENTFGGIRPVSIPKAYREERNTSIVIPKEVVDEIDLMLSQWEAGNIQRLDEIHSK